MHSPHSQPRYAQSIWPARWCQSIPSRSVSAQKQPQEQPLKQKFHFEVLVSTTVARVAGSSPHWLCPCSPPSPSQGPAFKDLPSTSQNCFMLCRIIKTLRGAEERETAVSSCGWVCYTGGRKFGFESCNASMLHTVFLYSTLAQPGQKHMAVWWSAVRPTMHTGIVLIH